MTHNWNPSTQLAGYLAAQASVAAGTAGATAEIVAVGDSTTLGYGGAANDYRPTVSYPADLAALLSQAGVPAQQDNFLGQGNNDFTTPDTRVSLVGGAFWGYPFVAGGPVVVTDGVGQGVTFTLAQPETYNTVTVSYIDAGTGKLNVAVNDGSPIASIQLGGTGQILTQTIALPMASYADITVTSASNSPADIQGISFANTVNPSVQVLNAGVGGAQSNVVGTGSATTATIISGAAALGANLALINFGINDILYGTLTAAQTTANIALMVQEFRAEGTDPVIIIPQPIAGAAYTAEIGTLRADIYALSDQLNVPVIDLSATYGDNATALAQAGLLSSDLIHPTATLYADIASGIAKLLTAAASGSTSGSGSTGTGSSSGNAATTPVVTTPPSVTLASNPTVANGGTVVLGTATSGADAVTATLKSDTAISSGSSVTIQNGNIVYAPGSYSATQATTDSITYTVTDSVTGAVTTETQSVTLGATASATPPAAVTIGSGASSIVLDISEDYYIGNAQFTISVDGVQIGGTQTAAAIHGAGQEQVFTVLGNFSAGSHTVTVDFLNDAYGGTATTDRNLYVDSITAGGTTQQTKAGLMGSGPQSFSVTLPATTTSTGTPASTGSASSGSSSSSTSTPTGGSSSSTGTTTTAGATVVVNLAEDAYQGNAQFIMSVDGGTATAPQSVTALNSAGQSQAFSLGTLSAGTHTIAVAFINDASGAGGDRNLYVTGISVGGTVQANSSAAILGDWADNFTITVPATSTSSGSASTGTTSTGTTSTGTTSTGTTSSGAASTGDTTSSSTPATTASTVTLGSGPDTLALQISEDAYLGDAQFTVSVNGVQIGGVQTATASHAAGQSQTFDILGSFSGSNTVSIDFLNDAYGGSATADRNLYETNATINGQTIGGAALTEMSSGAMSFVFQGSSSGTSSGTTGTSSGASSSTSTGSSGAATTAPSTTASGAVVVNLAEDAYQGNAQFIMSVDGGTATAPQSVTALNSAGQSQAFSLGDLSAGTHTIAIAFINDASGAGGDRNLYVTGISVGGAMAANSTAAILGNWAQDFSITVPSH